MTQETDQTNKIPIERCITRRVYKINARRLRFGVYDGNEGFIGIREKVGRRYLFTEYHWDQGPPYGTVSEQIDTGIDVPMEISLVEYLEGEIDRKTGRPLNKALFEFLEKIEREYKTAI